MSSSDKSNDRGRPRISRGMAIGLIIIGSALALSGVAGEFWLEWQSDVTYIPWTQFRYIEDLSPDALLIGLTIAVIGSIIWARSEVSTKTLKTSGYVLLACVFVGLMLTGVNVHSWTVTLAFVYAAAILIAVIFLGFALRRSDHTLSRNP